MRVLMLSLDRGLLGISASGDAVARHRRYADSIGSLDVIVFAPPSAREKLWADNFRVYPSGSGKLFHFSRAEKLAKKLASGSVYDLLVTQDFASPVGARLKRELHIPWIVSVHGMFFSASWLGWSPVNWYLFHQIKKAIRGADGFRVNNNAIKEKLQQWGIGKPILVQPTAIDIQKFKSQNSKVKITNQNSKLKILYVGRLSPEKNIGMLIQATKKIKHDLELQIVGSGTEEARLKGLAAGDDRIVFLGEKKYEDLPSIFQAADIFVLPSRTETFGQVLLQAAAAGCAIVATRTTGASAFITHLQNGWLTEVDNERELGAAIETLITDRRQRDDLAASAGKLAGEYDMNAATEKLIKFWKEVARK